jgi:hypothetical protein
MTAAIPHGPLDSRPDGYATTSERETLLRQLLADASVRLGAYDEVTVRWLATSPDWWTFAGIASLIRRAARE